MAAKRKPRKSRVSDEARASVLQHMEVLVAAGLAIRFPGDTRICLLTGERYAFREEGVVRID
jgi:hypothetical protein